MNNRDRLILEKLVEYCAEIQEAQSIFGQSEEAFAATKTYQNAVCMCILQIGELAGKLSDTVQEEISEIPWRAIRGMRNNIAHNYGRLDLTVAWETACSDIPALADACSRFLQAHPE